jgi:hypothetical protein
MGDDLLAYSSHPTRSVGLVVRLVEPGDGRSMVLNADLMEQTAVLRLVKEMTAEVDAVVLSPNVTRTRN